MPTLRISCILIFLSASVHAQKFVSLFNGKNLKGWSAVLKTSGINNDTAHIFTVENGLLHISGADIGYLVTDKDYSDFHLVAEFKWGSRKYPPRENRPRDNGILYYATRTQKIWPKAVECQVQEGDCGDIWLLDSITATIDSKKTIPASYARFLKKKDNEKPTGEWNRVEVIAKNGQITHIVNGIVVNEARELSERSGKIAIQSEMAEIFYRKIEIRKL